jgi:hypothetical protein
MYVGAYLRGCKSLNDTPYTSITITRSQHNLFMLDSLTPHIHEALGAFLSSPYSWIVVLVRELRRAKGVV